MSLLLGIAREFITPKIGCTLYGYRPDIYSVSVEDDLTATAFYFKNSGKEVLLISVALGSVNTELSDLLRRDISKNTGIPFDSVIISAIHTHSAPNLSGNYGWGDVDREYFDDIFYPALIKVAADAIANTQEAEMGIGTGNSDIGINRRELRKDGSIALGQNPWGCYNPQMTVITFRDTRSKKPIANIVHYGMHATCAGANTEISRDWPGVMCDVLEKESGAVTAFFNGPEGDVGPRLTNGETTGNGNIAYIYETGYKAAADALKIYKTIKVFDRDPALKVMKGEMYIPLEKRCSIDYAQAMLKKYEGETVNLEGAKKRYYENVLDSYEKGFVEKEAMGLSYVLFSLGDIAVVTSPYEVFSEIGLRISKFSPFPYTLLTVETNGMEDYFVTETEICRGGYEIDMFLLSGIQSPVKNADFYFINAVLNDLEKLYKEE